MPAEFESGVFTGNQPAWHGLGNVVADKRINAQKALDLSGLNSRVYKELVVRQGRGEKGRMGKRVEVPDHYFTIRETDDSVLGIVGSRYEVVQNVEAFDFMDNLLGDKGGFHYVTAGSLRGGKIVWLLAKPDFTIDLPDSPVEPYVFLTNRHDGRGAVQAAVTPIRVVCMNTLRFALQGAKASVKIRHTKTVREKMGEAQKVLGLAQGAADKLEANAIKLMEKRLFDQAFESFLKSLVPDAPEGAIERTKTNVAVTRNTIRSIYEGDEGGQKEIRGTAWGALNAVAAFTDHHQYGRNTAGASKEENRFERVLLNDNLTAKAAELLLPAKSR
jgi:phage/plasmid-like protein (TIGR03299 family)